MGLIGCTEMSVTNHQSTLRNLPEERISQIANILYFSRACYAVRPPRSTQFYLSNSRWIVDQPRTPSLCSFIQPPVTSSTPPQTFSAYFVPVVCYIGHILRKNCLLQQVIEGKIKGEIEVTERRGRRRRKLLDDLKERRGYSHLKEEL
jgi:hypothetical protein